MSAFDYSTCKILFIYFFIQYTILVFFILYCIFVINFLYYKIRNTLVLNTSKSLKYKKIQNFVQLLNTKNLSSIQNIKNLQIKIIYFTKSLYLIFKNEKI